LRLETQGPVHKTNPNPKFQVSKPVSRRNACCFVAGDNLPHGFASDSLVHDGLEISRGGTRSRVSARRLTNVDIEQIKVRVMLTGAESGVTIHCGSTAWQLHNTLGLFDYVLWRIGYFSPRNRFADRSWSVLCYTQSGKWKSLSSAGTFYELNQAL
jgi:hypothetical protein